MPIMFYNMHFEVEGWKIPNKYLYTALIALTTKTTTE